MVKLEDIAAKCEVSKATVSYVLNERGNERRISVAKQMEIKKAAEEMGYEPKLIEHKPLKIAIYWPHEDIDMVIPPIIAGINREISRYGYPLDVSIRTYSVGFLEDKEELFTNKDSVNAAIIIGSSYSDLEYLKKYRAAIPTVLFNRDKTSEYISITIDHNKASEIAINHALKKASSEPEKIFLVLSPKSSMFGYDQRSKAAHDLYQEHAPKDRPYEEGVQYEYCSYGIDSGYELGCKLIMNGSIEKIDVIVCIDDMAALGIVSALQENGCIVGKKKDTEKNEGKKAVQIIALSSGPQWLFKRTFPSLTVVNLKFEELAEHALRLAIELAKQPTLKPTVRKIHPEIICRASCPMSTDDEEKKFEEYIKDRDTFTKGVG